MQRGRCADDSQRSWGGDQEAVNCVRRPASPTFCREQSAPHRCVVCGSELVQATDWRQVEARSWVVALRCPECGAERQASLDRDAAHGFNVYLFDRAEELERELARLERSRLADDEQRAAAFVAALRDDLIVPSDF